jgi:hypothetical protein
VSVVILLQESSLAAGPHPGRTEEGARNNYPAVKGPLLAVNPSRLIDKPEQRPVSTNHYVVFFLMAVEFTEQAEDVQSVRVSDSKTNFL